MATDVTQNKEGKENSARRQQIATLNRFFSGRILVNVRRQHRSGPSKQKQESKGPGERICSWNARRPVMGTE
jgi:hypothetical protein